jgi:hypothetical protein
MAFTARGWADRHWQRRQRAASVGDNSSVHPWAVGSFARRVASRRMAHDIYIRVARMYMAFIAIPRMKKRTGGAAREWRGGVSAHLVRMICRPMVCPSSRSTAPGPRRAHLNSDARAASNAESCPSPAETRLR